MSDFLASMAKSSAERAANAPTFTAGDFDKPVVPLSLSSFDVIAEIKRRSPAEGHLSDSNPALRAEQYATGGAAAISVLTEPSRFDGSLEHLEEVVAQVPATPVMRKDFLVDPVQVLEARKAGASGVLLIFDADDLQRSARYLGSDGQLLIGVNTRNLRTLEVDPDRLQRLADSLPNAVCVAESGLRVAEDAARVAGWGYSMALVGTALMRSDDPTALIDAMRVAGAAACS
jgi:indole-3-glycerol phosphate synthase